MISSFIRKNTLSLRQSWDSWMFPGCLDNSQNLQDMPRRLTGTHFFFLFCSTIATNCVCKFSKGCMQFFKSYINITVGKRLKNVYMCEFLLFFLNIFLFCSAIATKYVCKVSKDHTWWFPCYINCCRKKLINVCRYKFLSVFLNPFFILLYYSYKMSKNI